jgi:hypothetical protein
MKYIGSRSWNNLVFYSFIIPPLFPQWRLQLCWNLGVKDLCTLYVFTIAFGALVSIRLIRVLTTLGASAGACSYWVLGILEGLAA